MTLTLTFKIHGPYDIRLCAVTINICDIKENYHSIEIKGILIIFTRVKEVVRIKCPRRGSDMRYY